ncbi:MAG: T9SS type A sorting domain-containing protein [Reichenbachiella sp.]
MKKLLLLFIYLLACTIGYAQTPTLVKDINAIHTYYGRVTEPITYNGHVYFIQDDGTNGFEVWRTDGTTTEIFTDIDNDVYGDPFSLTVWNGSLYFSTSMSSTWISDGTVPGTEVFTSTYGTIIPAATKLYLIDVYTRNLSITDGISGSDFIGTLGSAGQGGYQFTTLVDGLFYTIYDFNTVGNELVYEDGNPANPPVVLDIYPGTDGSFPGSFTVYDDKLYFFGVKYYTGSGTNNDGQGYKSLFESDGTEVGTISIMDENNWAYIKRTPQEINMTVFNNKLYYVNFSGASELNTDLTTYDGATHTVVHTFTNSNYNNAFKRLDFHKEINSVLYFRATDNKVLSSWETDGASVIASNLNLAVSEPTQLGDEIFYSSAQTLSSTDISGTVTEVYNYSNSSNLSVKGLTTLGGNLFFIAPQDVDASQLWKTDGTTTTQLTTNGITSTNGANPAPIFTIANNLYFTADDGTGTTLWKTDGTDINTSSISSIIPENGVEMNDEIFYTYVDGTNKIGKTDGTTFTELFDRQGTLSWLTASGSLLYYGSYNATDGNEIWVSDGTVGNILLLDLAPGSLSTSPTDLMDVNGTLYFIGLDLNKGTRGLWKSDGTLLGTTLVFSDANGDISQLTKYNDKLFFVYDDLFTGIEAKLYDTTIDDFIGFDLNESGDSEPHGFQEMGGEMYFFTKTPRQLWTSDGTVNGTVEVPNLATASNSNNLASSVFASSNALYFNYSSNQYSGYWIFDGTSIRPISISTSLIPSLVETIDNITYYIAGAGLWETDGTNEGTKLIIENANTSLFSIDSELYFGLIDDALGAELYKYQSDKQGFALTANSALNVTDNTEIDLTLDWTPGSGAGRIVLISTTENMGLPVDGETYTSNTVFGSSALGTSTNTFVIGNGASATTDVTGLEYGATYYISIIEYTEPTTGDFLFDRQNILRQTYLAPKIDQTINLPTILAKTYGDASFDVEATATSGQTVTYSLVSGPGNFSGNTLVITGAGDIVFDANVAEDATYYAATMETTVSVAKTALTATVTDADRAYGVANSAFDITYSGFVASEGESVLDVTPVPSTIADAASDVGSYDITMTTGSDDNYEIANTEGTLTITKAALTANVSDASKSYGEVNPEFTYSYSGFANEEDESVIDTPPTISTLADATSDAGIFAITASSAADNNYEIIVNDGDLTINQAPLSAVINDQERQYAQENVAATLTYTGFVNDDTSADIDSPPVTSTTATTFSDVGTYPITAANNGSDNNYIISTPTSGTLTVIKADQIITLDAIVDQDYSISNQVFVTSTISSSLQVALSVTGPATFTNGFITLDGTPGTVTVLANQVGDSHHNAATEVSVSFEAFTSDLCFDFEVSFVGSAFNMCNGESDASIDIVVSGGDNNYNYSWSSGQDTEDLASITAGEYNVTVTDGNNCSGTVTTTITDPDPVATPEITVQVQNESQQVLMVNNLSFIIRYEWFKDGVSIQDDESNQLSISEQGSYTVIAYNLDGCASEESAVEAIIITGLKSTLSASDINIYPNPASDFIIIDGNSIKSAAIYDLTGQSVLVSDQNQIQLRELKNGLYIIKIEGINNEIITTRFVKE